MAAVGIALAGAGIGGALTGSITGAMIGYSIGSAVGSLLFPPDLGKVEGPRLQDLQIQSSAEGASISTVYGSGRIAGNIIWGKPIQEHRHKEKSGGKGGGGGQTVVSYTYTADFAIGLCEGPISAVRKLWADGKLIMDMSEPTQAEKDAVAAGGFLGNVLERQQAFYSQTLGSGAIRIYTGSESQLPDALIEADLGAAQAPAWRGLAYIVFDGLELADYGNRIPNITAEVVVAGGSGIVYLGKQGPFQFLQTTLGAGDAKAHVFSNYVRPDKTLLALAWGFSFSNTNYTTADRLSVYPSGATQYAVRHSLGGGQPNNNLMAYCDVPAYFTMSGGILLLYESGALVGYFTTPDSSIDLLDNDLAATACWYVGGEVWVFSRTFGILYRALPLGSVPVVMTAHGDILPLIPGTIRSIWIGEVEIYVLSGSSNPFTLTVIDRESISVLRTVSVPISVTGAIDSNVRLYSQRTGTVHILYDSGVTEASIYVIEGTAGRSLGVVPLLTSPGVAAYQNFSIHDGVLTVSEYRVTSWSSYAAPMPAIGEIRYWSLDAIASNGVPLSTIVADICARSGLESGDINVTDLASTTVRGYLRSTQMTGRSAIEPLARGFLFDAVESDGVLKFVRRGGATVATIAADELGAAAEGQQAGRAITTLQQESELPIELSVQYMDAERDYQVGSQRSRRLVPDSELSSSVQLPIVLNGTEAKRTAEVLQYIAWTERAVHQFALPLDRLALDPGDAIILPIAGIDRRVRLTRVTLGQVVECEAVADDATVYVSSAAAAPTTSAQQSVTVVGETIAALLDVPILRDADDDAGFYAAAAGTGSGWHGAALYRSIDQLEWSRITAMTAASVLGTCQTALPTGPTTIVDDGSTVDVRLFAGGLFSVSELQMLSGENTCAIGSPAAGWEIVSFQTATLQADGSYRLSRLLRGRRGTEWAVGGHGIGDMFVLLEAGDLVRPVPANTDIGVDRYYRAPAFGGDFNEADTITYRHQAVGKRPYAVAHVTGRRHAPATNDWTLSWVRRSRIDGEWRDYVDVPLGEASESYEVDIMQGSTVKRTITGLTSPSAVYTAAQQTTDFGAVQTSLSVRVYQMSATVGRGTVSAATI